MQFVGLNSVHAGDALPKGVKDESATALMEQYQAITQPYQGGVSTNFAMPTSNQFYREGEADPFYAAVDSTTATKEITWEVADFDAATMEFYFGTTEPEEGKIYEGVKGFVFDAKSGMSIAFARLKYIAILTGAMNSSEPMRISVSATVLAPAEGGVAWWPIETPEYGAQRPA